MYPIGGTVPVTVPVPELPARDADDPLLAIVDAVLIGYARVPAAGRNPVQRITALTRGCPDARCRGGVG